MDNKDKKFHEYDGIIELDHPLPTWWLWTFFLTIMFSGIYFLHYVIAGGPTLKDELKVAMSEIDKVRVHSQSANLMESEDSLRAAFAGEEMQKMGAAQFTAKCVACHGANLEGLIGPNLTDQFWIHGAGSRMDLVKLIRQGIPDKGMPPWEGALKKEEVYALASYILSKKGTNPQGAKEAQGNSSDNYLKSDW